MSRTSRRNVNVGVALNSQMKIVYAEIPHPQETPARVNNHVEISEPVKSEHKAFRMFRTLVRMGYSMFKKIFRPLAYRMRRYFTESVNSELSKLDQIITKVDYLEMRMWLFQSEHLKIMLKCQDKIDSLSKELEYKLKTLENEH